MTFRATDEPCTDSNWMTTRTGTQFWPGNPRVQDVNFEDIAWALPHVPRFAGHTNPFFSVAGHSLLVSGALQKDFGDPKLAIWGLMHDATEAYIGDIPRPFKNECPEIRVREHKLMAAIAKALSLPELDDREQAVLKHYDNRSLVTEVIELMPPGVLKKWGKWTEAFAPLPLAELVRDGLVFFGYDIDATRALFRDRYFALQDGLGVRTNRS